MKKQFFVTLLALIVMLFAVSAVAIAETATEECDHEWIKFGFGAGYCIKCGEINTNDEEMMPDIECVDHVYDVNTGKCSKCGAEQPKTECEHDWIKFSFGGWVCSKCAMITVNNPHPAPSLPEGDPECEHEWIQATYSGWVCTKCGAMTINQPGCKHEETFELQHDATCVEAGWIKVYCANTECTKIVEEKVLPIDPEAHGETKTETVAATCKTAGYIKELCSLCGAVLSEEILPVDPSAHNWVDGVCTICGATQAKMFYNNHMTSFGPMTSEVIGGKDWYRVTPVDLSVDGVYTYDLIASNRFVIGKVTFTVSEGTLTVAYTVNVYGTAVESEVLKIYASKEAMAAGEAVEATVGEAINIAETFGEDTKVIVSLILTGDYDSMAKSLKTMKVDADVIAEMIANMD